MRKNELMLHTAQLDPALEALIRKRDAELKELADKNARHFAKFNQPNLTGDHLEHYTGELKAGYEKLAAEVSQLLQPAAHLPEGKMDIDNARDKDGELDASINKLERQNNNDADSLSNFHPEAIYARIRLVVIATFIITIGEIVFNTKAFQVTGESMLFSLLLSISASVAVFIFSHMVPFLYKAAKNKLQRIAIVVGSFLFVTGLFIAFAIFRSTYLQAQNVHIKPVYFVIINLFFFIVSSLLSFFILPTWQEIKQNAVQHKQYKAIEKRKKRIEQLKKEQAIAKEAITEITKQRIRLVQSANYSADVCRKMYKEAIAIFKRTNLAHRLDHRTPDCFNEEVPDADIPDVTFNAISLNNNVS